MKSGSTPRHVWFVGGLALLWGAVSIFAYLGSVRGSGEISGVAAWEENFRGWGMWAGLIGAGLMLARCRLSVPVLGASLVSVLADFIWRLAGGAVPFSGSSDALSFGFAVAGLAISAALLDYVVSLSGRGHFETSS